jgi:putative phosphoesterase
VIALLGDTHLPRGARRLPDACIDLLRDAELIVHTGDFTSLAVVHELARLGPLRAVHGNVDEPDVKALLPARLVVEHEGLRIGVVHDGGRRQGREARLRGWFPECDVVAFGHSHQPELLCHDGCWLVNPGSPTERRRAPRHTMAIIEREVPRLVVV